MEGDDQVRRSSGRTPSRRTAHRTVEPINRLDEDEFAARVPYVHESNISSRAPQRQSSHTPHKRGTDLANSQYGKYLSQPTGSKRIFTNNPNPAPLVYGVIAIAILAILVLIALFIWSLIPA